MSRISPATTILLIFAVLFGLVGAYAVRRYTAKPPVAAAPPPPPAERKTVVPVAAGVLKAGRKVTMGDIALLRLSSEELAKSKYVGSGYMTNPQQIVGRVLSADISRGESFKPDSLYPEGMGPSLSERLKPGYRAVTISVSGSGILQGLADSGSLVDVLFRTKEDPTRDYPETTVPLIEAVEVLAVNDNTMPGVRGPANASNVTLAVNGTQAHALKIAEGRGEFSLALRNPTDGTFVTHEGPTTLESLLKLPPRTKYRPKTIEIYRGPSKTNNVFDVPSAPAPAAGVPAAGAPVPGAAPAAAAADASVGG